MSRWCIVRASLHWSRTTLPKYCAIQPYYKLQLMKQREYYKGAVHGTLCTLQGPPQVTSYTNENYQLPGTNILK